MRNIKNLALFVLMLALVSTTAVADIHYVNPGESIQAAIDAAYSGDEIAVAPGFYTETIYFMGKAIRLYSIGGPDLTIIDGQGVAIHVVACINGEGPDTILEGFTITGGNASGGGSEGCGGGMYNENASPTVTNCIFTGNTAELHGGGMYNLLGSPTVTNCTFTNNTANAGKGGGMHNDSSSPTVTNCTFSHNTADAGGGLFIELGSPTVTNCTFTNNTAMDHAGMGIFKSSPAVTNCTFSGNTVERFGGGMSNVQSSSTVTNCTFADNTASIDGGGMWNDGCSPTITNCTFTDNTASIEGGGMCNRYSSPMVTNCTFSGNIAIDGGGMCNRNTSSPTVTNCILWADSPDEIFDEPGSSTTVTYSDVQGGWPGTGNIDADPLFADADLRLSFGSPCINAGSNAALPPDTADLDGDGDTTEPIPLDLDGNARIFNGVVDMGAFELEFTAHDLSGWVWIQSGGDFGYSYNEDDLLYFLSFGPVWYYNTATSQWGEEGPVGWTYVNWPFLYESATSTTIFALPPEDGLWVYHFRPSQWTVSPRIIP